MTNKDALIKALNDGFDDPCYTEAIIFYSINCPYYYGDPRCECMEDGKEICRDICSECKSKWLESEVDE